MSTCNNYIVDIEKCGFDKKFFLACFQIHRFDLKHNCMQTFSIKSFPKKGFASIGSAVKSEL